MTELYGCRFALRYLGGFTRKKLFNGNPGALRDVENLFSCLANMGRRRPYMDPYDAMMNRLERNGLAYALVAIAALVASFVVWNFNNEGASQFEPLVDQVRSVIAWSTRTLQGSLDSMLFERMALSRKPEELFTSELATLSDQGVLGTNLVLKDPYVVDFLELRDHYL